MQYVLPSPPPPLVVSLDQEGVDREIVSLAAEEKLTPLGYDFDMDESLLDAALGGSSPLKQDSSAKSHNPEPDIDMLAWMGGQDIEDTLAKYDHTTPSVTCPVGVNKDEVPVSASKCMTAMKLHITMGREAVVNLPTTPSVSCSTQYLTPVYPCHCPDPTTATTTPTTTVPTCLLMTWRWGTVLYSKVMAFGSEAEFRPNPILQVT